MAGESENVRIVRALYDAFARRDHDYPFTVYDEDIEWDARGVPMADLTGVYRGHDGVRRFWRTWLVAWQDLEFRIEDMVESGDTVVAFMWQRQRGRTTGIWTDFPRYAQIWTLRDGKVIRLRYAKPEEARAELGLDETD